MIPEGVRRGLGRFIHHPVTELTLLLLIVASVALMLGELALGDRPRARLTLEVAGYGLTALFAVELLIRWAVHRSTRSFLRSYWLDIFAVVPIARPLRFFRVFRLLRIFRAGVLLNRRMSSWESVFRGTMQELTSLAAITLTVVLAGAVVLNLAEGGANPELSDLKSALQFAALSLIAGEPMGTTPMTDVGWWVTAGLMLAGLTVFGMFVGTVSAGVATRLASRGVYAMCLDDLTDHVVVCGWNRSGPTVLRELFARDPDTPVVVVTELAEAPPDWPDTGVRLEHLYYHHGDWTRIEVLEHVGIVRASRVILLTDTRTPRSDQDRDARTVLAALTIEKMVPGIYTVVELTSPQSASLLRMAGVEEIVVGDWYAGQILAAAARNPGLVRVLDDILTTATGSAFYSVPAGLLVGHTVAEAHQRLLLEHRAVLVSVHSASEDAVNPKPARVLVAGDVLVVLAPHEVRL